MTGDGYAGDVTSVEAMEILRNTAGAVLLDVRTDAEWTFVGRPDLSSLGREPVLISWQTFPGMAPNGGFVEAVRRSIQAKDVPVLVMCRSGQRSKSAAIALTEAGYGDCRNISDGFEGPKDEDGHRNTVAGWRANGLPWQQG
ncbi:MULTISPECIES: rhodanese-like domain-containing protein [Thalassobaculum]|uniref:Thiosulfate sulfurtransferase n=1 Tax=Thalassobaculum litoreum DSM 18839 TaxID=1123362 RepID=A0A8G2EY95_9PROT|nr:MULTISPECIES: rhodanese-like domain-containing protein [Thalassobaculum]SDF53906.1 thiosulfate sulfurtransferase [Thalassobaculum litoreum DSM 18839]